MAILTYHIGNNTIEEDLGAKTAQITKWQRSVIVNKLNPTLISNMFSQSKTTNVSMLINLIQITNFVLNHLNNDTWITVNMLLELILLVDRVSIFQITIFNYLKHRRLLTGCALCNLVCYLSLSRLYCDNWMFMYQLSTKLKENNIKSSGKGAHINE